jgi:hypothetical protein
MKQEKTRSLSKPWRLASASIAAICVYIAYAVLMQTDPANPSVHPLIPGALSLVFGAVALSGRTPL